MQWLYQELSCSSYCCCIYFCCTDASWLCLFSLLVHTLPQKKRLSIATSLSDRSDTDSVDGSPLHHAGSVSTPPLPSSATPPSTICRTSSQHDSSERDRSSTPLSNGSAEERVIVVKVSFCPWVYVMYFLLFVVPELMTLCFCT